jgi:hypothetical protein
VIILVQLCGILADAKERMRDDELDSDLITASVVLIVS